MHITGPFRDAKKRRLGRPKQWYLRVRVPMVTQSGAPELNASGRLLHRRQRPYYSTRDEAMADIPRLRGQHGAAGVGSAGVLTRARLADADAAQAIVPAAEASLLQVARFWRIHHPLAAASRIRDLTPAFLEWVKARVGETRHYSDLRSRIGPVQDRSTGALCDTRFLKEFGDRLPATVTREEFIAWLLKLGRAGRTVLNQKRAVVNFYGYLVDTAKVLPTNPLAGIKKRALPRQVPKEIAYLPLDQVLRYLRSAERYDPELIAHEIVQLFAGVRSDDEMADFDGRWIMAPTKQVVIPAAVAKTGRREVIDSLEPVFWTWWAAYGRVGLLRPTNYLQRWQRLRILAAIEDQNEADQLAALPIKTLRRRAASTTALTTWPWNARRRTFCTYHVAKHQSADKTALILRHRGNAATLHNSYRGLGVTQEQGAAYFQIMPERISSPITPERPERGIIRLQKQRRRSSPPAAPSQGIA